MSKEATLSPTPEMMSVEEKAFLLKAVWTALRTPVWTKDDITEFGKAVFFNLDKQLPELNRAVFERIIPSLVKIRDSLAVQLMKHSIEFIAAKEQEKVKEQEQPSPVVAPESIEEKSP